MKKQIMPAKGGKKIIFLLSVLIGLAGCQATKEEVSNVNVNENTNVSKQEDFSAIYSQLGLGDLLSQYNGAILKTNFGNIKVKFYNEDSPLTVNNFLNLAKKGFYNDTKFHRVISDFMIQGGDPNSKDGNWADDGRGDPGYKFKDEINAHKLVRGSL